jgi:nucleoside phosphorylase
MVGIAGGAPHPNDPDKHVRLGDVVVCDQNGIVQFDHVKWEQGHIQVRSAAPPPSASLLGKVGVLEAARLAGSHPWEQHIQRAKVEGAIRPEASEDRLFASGDSVTELIHPDDPYRRSGQPRIHYGAIGSSNVLLKDPEVRDALRDNFGVRAIEMEGSGIADGTWTARLGYIVIRGICDYCDRHKNDTWQGYAAVAAAAYARALIESFPIIVDPVAQRHIAAAKSKLAEARAEIGNANHDSAATLAEDAAELAHAAGDNRLERKAVLQAVRAWAEHLERSDVPELAYRKLRDHVQHLVERLASLGERPGLIALEVGLLDRARGEPSQVLQLAIEASSDQDPAIRADAMLLRLQVLWRMSDLESAVGLAAEVTELKQAAPDDTRLFLDGTWLRTLCKAGKYTDKDVQDFASAVLMSVERSESDHERTAMLVGEVASEFNRAGHLAESRRLCEAAYDLTVPLGNCRMLATIALQVAELSAELNDAEKAKVYLGRAESWAARQEPREGDDVGAPETLRALVLFAKGRTLTRIADRADPPVDALHQAAYDALQATHAFAVQNRLKLHGNVELFLADLSWWLGRKAASLGRLNEAHEYLAATRSDSAMTNPHFCAEVVSKAWLLEAETLALSGRVDEAEKLAEGLVNESRLPDESKERAHTFLRFLKSRIRPTWEWFNSADALAIARDCGARGLRSIVAEQVRPLVGWWHDWREEKSGIETLFFDFWGRGGFSRVAAAIRAKAHAAIAVDASTVAEIRTWARILCPLFETVIVKWKGELGTGMVIVPQHGDYAGAGGHGYAVTVDRTSDKRYVVSMSWANPIPPEVTTFLAREALSLFSAGRLLVVPAPLVGCSQSAVGWTDNLLVDGLLGGVVNVGRRLPSDSGLAIPTPQRILDLTQIRLPFIDNIEMADLASVLDETERWIRPLRRRIMGVLASGDLNNERWAGMATLEQEIQDGCQELKEAMSEIARGHGWHLDQVDGAISAGSRGPAQPARESVTGFLQSIVSDRRDLAPWIPYWRLQDRGGYLNWTCPLDNRSTPPDSGTLMRMAQFGAAGSPDMHSWLYPGTPGWFFPTAIRI